MPIKYFGIKTLDFGRPLWEIVLNLKNFGQGRYIVKSFTESKYPDEPSFFKILNVRPHVIEYPNNLRGNILVEMVHRGRRRPDPVDIGHEGFRADYRLVLREDEPGLLQKLKEFEAKPQEVLVLPRTAPLPPLWKEILARENKTKVKEVQEMPLVWGEIDPYEGRPKRVAEVGDTPSFKIGPGNFQPLHPELYNHVLWSREEAKMKLGDVKPEPEFIYEKKVLPPVDINMKRMVDVDSRVKASGRSSS